MTNKEGRPSASIRHPGLEPGSTFSSRGPLTLAIPPPPRHDPPGMKAPVHPQESARLGALRRYGILDTPRERDFDDVVAFAAALCGAPMSTITLIDADRQWFKAEVGMGFSESPREMTFCAHAILDDDFIEIPDTLADPRTRDFPFCSGEPHLRFYAGALLRSGDGHPIGTLCVIDTAPRRLTDVQRQGLRVLATQVMAQIELRATLARETLLRREIDHRVKNSLQSVGAFVRLQRGTTDNADAAEALAMVEQQVGTVAVLHDLLGQSVAAEEVELSDYLSRVVALLGDTTPANLLVEGTFAPLATAASVAASLGTVINELVANAVKHSFDDGRPGRIELTGRLDDGVYRIACRDDGHAHAGSDLPPQSKRDGLGMKIMAAAVRQLDGTLVGAPTIDGYASLLEFPAARPGA